MRAFVAVIGEQGFTGAAEALQVSQSSVSRSVAALERELGLRLLERGQRGQHHLTPFGRQVLGHARHILDRIALVHALARTAREETGSTLRVGIMPSLGPLLVSLTAAYQRDQPTARVVFLEGKDEEVRHWLSNGFVDLATFADNVPSHGPDVEVPFGGRPVVCDRWVAVLRHDHPLASETDIPLSELEDDQFLLSDGGCEHLLRELFSQAGVALQPAMRIADVTTLLTLVDEGLGVTIIPELTFRHFPTLHAVPVASDLVRRVSLVQGAHPRAEVTRYFDYVTAGAHEATRG